MTPIVAASVLVHNNQFGLTHVLRCLSAQNRPPDVVIVIDNASVPPAVVPIELGGQHLAVDLRRQPANLGVGAGHNAGIHIAMDEYAADCVWVLEHDTFPDPGCLKELLAAADAEHDPAIYAARLTRNNYERRWAADSLELPRASEPPGHKAPITPRFETITLNGILLSRSVVELVGWLREDYIVGHEDWDYSRRAHDAGVKVRTVDAAVAIHPNKGDGRFGNTASPMRYYYSHRNLLASQDMGARQRTRSAVGGIARAFAEGVRPSRGPRYTAARLHAVNDGLRGRLGARQPFGVAPRSRGN